MRTRLLLVCLLIWVLLTGCSNSSYYLQSVTGHLALMHAAKPVDQWLADPQTDPGLKSRLQLAQRIRRFAVTDLGLPDNASYQRYADLHRPAVVWNVVAAPADSLTLKTWCFPVVGCVGYRGYYDQAQANTLAAALQSEGLEVSVYGVPAYSTLGWMNWAGGDPLLNTFIRYPEGELARMVFHELAHQVLFVKNDTPFNESFATAVERMGSARWLTLHATPAAQAEYARFNARRNQFRALVRATRLALSDIYAQKSPLALAEPAQAAMKLRAMEKFRADYAALKASWSETEASTAGYDRWVDKANNAAFGSMAAYDAWVPGFEALFQREAQGNTDVQAWERFFEAARQLAAMPATQRTQALERLLAHDSTMATPEPEAHLAISHPSDKRK